MHSLRVIDKIYGMLVNRVPGIRERYRRMRLRSKGIRRGTAWLYLLYLNIAYYIFRCRSLGELQKYPYYEEKILYTKGSESSLSRRQTPEEFAEELAAYDVISLDVFDTLVFRPFSAPADVFFVLEEELGYMDFKRIRMEMEWKARREKYESRGHYEINLEEIYTVLSRETGIDKEKTMKREVELEEEYCFANPYMYKVVEKLREKKARIVVTSDMYLNADQMEHLLRKCGYGTFDAYYVSCDAEKSKSQGTLYEEVKKQEKAFAGENLTFVHVGDNPVSDIRQAKKHGFAVRYYRNVNDAGRPYRPEDMSAITGSIYRGVVNAHIHNGLKEYSREYEYGFIYGGLFVAGYCQFVHRYVKEHQIDKILFLARDGDVLKKAYERLYPGESQKCAYVYWSRLAAVKMTAGHFKYDYFRRFLTHKVNQGYTLEQVFSSMELEDMLPSFCRDRKEVAQARLTEKNAEEVKEFLLQNFDRVLGHYKEQVEAGEQYFAEILKGCRKAAAVDVGWAGSGAVALGYLTEKVWKLSCDITGIIAGTNTCHNVEPDAGETFLQTGKLVSYLYSQRENRDLWKFHDAGKNHNLYWETLLDAPHGSLIGFYPDEEKKVVCRFKPAASDGEKVLEIQRGILDFTEMYREFMKKSALFREISGRDAYAPMINAQSEVNENFMERFVSVMDEKNI